MRKPVETPQAPRPLGPYSQGIVDGDLVYVAGQGPLDPATGQPAPGDVGAQTARTLENVRAILEAAGASLESVIRCNVYLTDMREFPAMNAVYARAFSAPHPARTTVEVSALPGGIAVEIDCIARRAAAAARGKRRAGATRPAGKRRPASPRRRR
jgi:2-iminobutanoate/2-iminopropanoate deaminase